MARRVLILLTASLTATGGPGCSHRACEQGAPAFQVDLELSGAEPNKIQALEADVTAAGLRKVARLDPGPLIKDGKAAFVVNVGDPGSGGFTADVSVTALGIGGVVLARGKESFSASGDACNRFSLQLSSATQDGGVPDVDMGADVGPTCGPASCLGCCRPDGVCASGTTDSLCGTGGAVCVDCTSAGGSCKDNTCDNCVPKCAGEVCGASDGCGGTCQAGSGCCTPSCAGKVCGTTDGCGGTCNAGSGCTSCVQKADSDTLALYTFGGSGTTVSDVTGNHHGTLVDSGAARVNSKSGCDKALSFSGSSAYIEIPDSSDWQLSAGSVDLWVRFDGATSDFEGIMSRDALSQSKPGHFGFTRWCNGSIVVRVQDTSSSWSQCSDPVTSQTWHHVGVNFGTGGLELYVDGKKANRTASITCGQYTANCGTSSGQGIGGNNNPWVIGIGSGRSSEGSATPVQNPLEGRIDSLRISKVRRTF